MLAISRRGFIGMWVGTAAPSMGGYLDARSNHKAGRTTAGKATESLPPFVFASGAPLPALAPIRYAEF